MLKVSCWKTKAASGGSYAASDAFSWCAPLTTGNLDESNGTPANVRKFSPTMQGAANANSWEAREAAALTSSYAFIGKAETSVGADDAITAT